MATITSVLSLRTKHKIDFYLVPVAIIIIELSIFITQLSSDPAIVLENLLLLRLIHTVVMVFLSIVVSRLYLFFKKPAVNYLTIALTGIFVLALGDALHTYFASLLQIQLVDVNRRIGIVIIQGIIWFPTFMIVLGYRLEIVKNLKLYGQRLIADSRVRSRTSIQIAKLRDELQSQIRRELISIFTVLKESISKVETSSLSLAERNLAIQSILSGDELRKFSRELETHPTQKVQHFRLSNKSKSLYFFLQQFWVLYSHSLRRAPLGALVYSTALLALVAPILIYFYSPFELLCSFPLIFLASIAVARLIGFIQKKDSPFARLTSSVLITMIGLLLFASDLAWQIVFPLPQPRIPVQITLVAAPITYFLFMAILQVLRPGALSLIQKEQLTAGKALQQEVTRMVTEEFSKNLSHKWAVFIHGKILTRLAATALKLDADANSRNSIGFEVTVLTLESVLKAPDVDFDDEVRDLESEVSSRLEPWVGLVEVNINIEQALKSLTSPRVRDLGEVLEELISNSIRHGRATKLEVQLTRIGEKDLELLARDNAILEPPTRSNSQGLGTRIFNLVSDGRWSLRKADVGTEFRLRMSAEV